ncbi:MAG: HAD family phosphatase [Planctomycetia bacterium]|nr:HAD family phosphatase [Planctomycetia bacterium]
MPPDFIYFDLGNVVFFFDRERAFRQMAEASGVDAARVRDAVMDGGLQQALERGDIGWGEFHAEFSRRTGTRPDPGRLARATSDMFDLNVAMLPVIAACNRAGIPLGILSNTCDPHWRFLASGDYGIVPGTFREIVLSHEVRMAKPDRGIYEFAASRAGVEPARIFFCDDLTEHVAAARAAGWDAELFTAAHVLTDQLTRRGLPLGL